MSKDKIAMIEKIKKLIRLADIKSGATPAEAANAAAKAQALLLEHNLVMEDIGDLEAHVEDEKVKHTKMDLEATYSTSRWHANLLHLICKPLFCRVVYQPAKAGKAGSAHLFGKPSNVEVVKYFYSYLHRAIDLMAVEHREKWKAQMVKKGETWIPDEAFRVRIDFCLGASATVGERLIKMYEEAVAASSSTTALVVVSDHALALAQSLVFPRTSHTTSYRMVDGSAREAGREAGKTISLHRGVAAGSRQKALAGK